MPIEDSLLPQLDQILAAMKFQIVGLKIKSIGIKIDIEMYIIMVYFRGRIKEVPYIMMKPKVKLQGLMILEQQTLNVGDCFTNYDTL